MKVRLSIKIVKKIKSSGHVITGDLEDSIIEKSSSMRRFRVKSEMTPPKVSRLSFPSFLLGLTLRFERDDCNGSAIYNIIIVRASISPRIIIMAIIKNNNNISDYNSLLT